jgi:hypothetical protein
MRIAALTSLSLLLFAAIGRGQSLPTYLPPTDQSATTTHRTVMQRPIDLTTPPLLDSTSEEYVEVFARHHIWGDAGYLLAWIRRAPIGVPLVTTGPATDPLAGHLDNPSTGIVLGVHGLDTDPTSGGRFRAGLWFDADNTFGVEIAGFLFAPSRGSQAVVSDANGSPILSRPVIVGGAEQVYDIAFPGMLRGGFGVDTSSRLEGLELNLVGFAFGDRNLSLELLGGIRYMRLAEDLNLRYAVTPLVDMEAFGGMIPAGSDIAVLDAYRTTNHFYGGQLGARGEWSQGPFSLGLSGKLGLGVNDQTIRIDGSTALRVPGAAPTAFVGGILANPANMGRFETQQFAVVPELGVTLGYWITPRVRATVGYNVLFWSDVLRPGQQIDRIVNPALIPIDRMYTPGIPIQRTSPLFLRSDFWAESLMLGLDIRF